MSLFRYPSHPSCSPSKLLTSTKDWQYLLEDLVKKDDSIPTVATGDGQFSWEELIVLMMECLGVEETGRMLLECDGVCVGREEVMVKVHSMIVELSSLQRQQRYTHKIHPSSLW